MLVEWAERTPSCLPAESAKTARTFEPECVPGWPSWASSSTRELNAQAKGEARISSPHSRTQVWIMPTNEELVVARQSERVFAVRRQIAAIGFLAKQQRRTCFMFVAKVTGAVVATQKVESMVGRKLLIVEPYRHRFPGPQPAGQHRAHVCGRRYGRSRRWRIRAHHPRFQRPADPRDQEPADRHRDHRHRRYGPCRPVCVFRREAVPA